MFTKRSFPSGWTEWAKLNGNQNHFHGGTLAPRNSATMITYKKINH